MVMALSTRTSIFRCIQVMPSFTSVNDKKYSICLLTGCGRGAYKYAFERVVMPALDAFEPDLIMVSSGFDASFADPLGAMILTSESYREFTTMLMGSAEKHCGGRIIFSHEGGYSKDYVPYCGLAVVETLSGHRTDVRDPYLEEAHLWGYQHLLPHQEAVIDAVASLHGLNSLKSKRDSDDHEQSVAVAMQRLLDTVKPDKRASVVEALIAIEKGQFKNRIASVK